MNNLEYYFGANLPEGLSAKMEAIGMIQSENKAETFVKDAFYGDGSPRKTENNTVYPCYAPVYTGCFVPGTYLDVAEKYRRTASVAAVSWLCKATGLRCDNLSHFNGFRVNLKDFFCCPDGLTLVTPMLCVYSDEGKAYPVIPWPDSRENDEDWKNGTIPYYAQAVVSATMWAWRVGSASPAEKAFIVRITGNTPGDAAVRTVFSDIKQENLTMERIVRAFCKSSGAEIQPDSAVKRLEQADWLTQKQEKDEMAFVIENDASFHDLVASYLATKSERMTMEIELKESANRMSSLALELASHVESGKIRGRLNGTSGNYTVSHIPGKRPAITSRSINAAIIQQYFPQYSGFIKSSVAVKERVSIETV